MPFDNFRRLHTFRLLWAEALDDEGRTAVCFQWGDRIIGGIGWTTEMTISQDSHRWRHGATMGLKMALEWYQVVHSPDDFRTSERYRSAKQKQIEASTGIPIEEPEVLLIEHKKED